MPSRNTHVSEPEYLRAVEQVDAVFHTNGIETELGALSKRTASKFNKIMSTVSMSLIRIDGTLKATHEEVVRTRHATLTGVLAGVAIVRAAYQPYTITTLDLVSDLENTGIGNDEEEDRVHDVNQAWRDIGWQGIRRVGHSAEEYIEKWEDAIVRDVRYRELFRIGSGIIIESAYLFFEEKLQREMQEDRARFEHEVENLTDFDWDQALGTLMDTD